MGLVYSGVDLFDTYGIMVDSSKTWVKPERDREFIHVPGRSGDLILDNGAWQNVEIEYTCHIDDNFYSSFEDFSAWLSSIRGYEMLFDEHHPDVYRLATPTMDFDPKTTFTDRTADFTLVFNCKPQQYINDGVNHDIELDYSSADVMADIQGSEPEPDPEPDPDPDPDPDPIEDDMGDDDMGDDDMNDDPVSVVYTPLAGAYWDGIPVLTVFGNGKARVEITNGKGTWTFKVAELADADYRIVIDFETGNAVIQDEMGDYVGNGNSYFTVIPPSSYADDFPHSDGIITAYHTDPDDPSVEYTGHLILDPRFYRI